MSNSSGKTSLKRKRSSLARSTPAGPLTDDARVARNRSPRHSPSDQACPNPSTPPHDPGKGTGQPLPEDNWTWTPQGVINIHYPEMWGYVQFSAKLPGQGKEKFLRRPEEKVKWALRKIYYAERARDFDKPGFVDSLEALGLGKDPSLKIKGWSFPPEIRTTPGLFEVVYTAKAGESWHIRQDGLVWKETPSGPVVK